MAKNPNPPCVLVMDTAGDLHIADKSRIFDVNLNALFRAMMEPVYRSAASAELVPFIDDRQLRH